MRRGHPDGAVGQWTADQKWSTNCVSLASYKGLSEGMNFAVKAGLDAETVIDVVSKGARPVVANGKQGADNVPR